MNTVELDQRGVLVGCPRCGQRNRITYERVGQTVYCGKCHAELQGPAATAEVKDEQSFQALIERSALPVVVDFWAPWCGPCKIVAPEFEKVASDGAGHWIVARVDSDELPSLAQRFQINSIPTVVLFREGHEVARQSGAMPATGIRQFIQRAEFASR
jgi:thioredoxin 2